ncbi:AraC family transcriptional regulator [Phaeobacter gallaeciensis]|uniref:AraC family transcriptional regulator n=1 Tax=Phaeobacter gallaeciensis TaxID=60890 RepID=A0A1B0ZMZ9_9RHOB|nr:MULTISPECIES: AraC family transcriptional regulator [Phaeobacter]MDF1773897.1 AraC family transcriptional regulator ligand-binding domain-containing protein [Pseudophaeobacter sp. bin_em_oilr2.035]MEE2634789.1 AraC family transcriptional regulator ligand-binding domain-containing protein [Pseudomonadota bacterium]ANP35546.1 AraC family transcriptional regulator [Phaeobacter gallaeciensis]MDE4063384.1 AraC family transcriptional regulator ligand-binding domain-containing protein [Phaeobacter 
MSPLPPEHAQGALILPTVSRAFLEDWLSTLRVHCAPGQLAGFLDQIGLDDAAQPLGRVTHDQIVRLYQLVASETGDEMMGLWSRPVRSGALKLLCTSVLGASSLSAALFRFSSFWNLVLDDCRVRLETGEDRLQIVLEPQGDGGQNRFGHMLLLKLAHGIASWVAGRELPLREVSFAFQKPEFAEDYPILFPAPVRFGEVSSSLTFDGTLDRLPVSRSEAEMQEFLIRAPRDWIFTSFREHAVMLRVRELLLQSERLSCNLEDAARVLNLTPRTLIRRLDAENTSFQEIKDGLRRDIAIRDLSLGAKSIEAVSQDVGFASAANFHRAFKRWTGTTPGSYRRSDV